MPTVAACVDLLVPLVGDGEFDRGLLYVAAMFMTPACPHGFLMSNSRFGALVANGIACTTPQALVLDPAPKPFCFLPV